MRMFGRPTGSSACSRPPQPPMQIQLGGKICRAQHAVKFSPLYASRVPGRWADRTLLRPRAARKTWFAQATLILEPYAATEPTSTHRPLICVCVQQPYPGSFVKSASLPCMDFTTLSTLRRIQALDLARKGTLRTPRIPTSSRISRPQLDRGYLRNPACCQDSRTYPKHVFREIC